MKIPKLNRKQLDKLSDIASDVALVSLASIVLPAMFDRFDVTVVLLGLLATIFLWAISLLLRR